MEEKQSPAVEKIRAIVRDPVIMFGLVVGVIAIIIIVISIVSRRPEYKWEGGIEIDNIGEVEGLSEQDQKQFAVNLSSFVASSLPEGAEVPTSGAHVREGSISESYDPYSKVYARTFVIDIEAIKQSYAAAHYWADDKADLEALAAGVNSVTCPRDNQLVFGKFLCIAPDDPYRMLTDDQKLSARLPYIGETETGVTYNIFHRTYADERPYIEVGVGSCGDKKIQDEGEKAAREYLEILEVNLEDFPIEYRTLCDGAF